VGRKGTGINFQVERRMGIVKLRLLGARLVFFWVVEGGSGWEVERAQGYPRETGPVLEYKLRRRHVIEDQYNGFSV
jgi:hypothetical protein